MATPDVLPVINTQLPQVYNNPSEVEETPSIDIDKIEHEIGMLRLIIVRDLRSFLHAENLRASNYHEKRLKLYADSFRSVLPLVVNGLSCTSQAFASFAEIAVPVAEQYTNLCGINSSVSILKQFSATAKLGDAIFKTFKEFIDSQLAAKRAEANQESAKSLVDFISQTYKKYQQEENEIQRELDQRESKKNDFDSSMTRFSS
jgi:hypothetical protein